MTDRIYPADEYEADIPGTGPAREILGCLLPYDVETGEFINGSGAEGRIVRICVRPYGHTGACRLGGPPYRTGRMRNWRET